MRFCTLYSVIKYIDSGGLLVYNFDNTKHTEVTFPMKKHISLLILASIILSAVSCGGDVSDDIVQNDTSSTADSTSAAQGTATRIDELGSHDFGGETFTILDANNMPTIHQNIPDDTMKGDMINDKLAERNKQIEDLYNIKFAYDQRTENGANLFRNSVMAGDNAYDMIISVINSSVGTLANDGLLADLCSLDALSLDKEWWSPLIYENLKIDGKIYYTSGDISPAIYCAPACYFVNKKLATDYNINIDDLYASVENGTWTLDKLFSTAGNLSSDLNGDDRLKIDDDFFGILNGKDNLTAAVFAVGAGVRFTEPDENGDLICDLGSPRTADVISKLKSTIGASGVQSDGTQQHEAFKNDRAIFFMHYTSSAYTRYRDMESDFMILPLPKYDESQSSYYSYVNTWANAFIGLPKNGKNDRAAIILESMAYLSHENLRPLVYDMAFKNKGARNEKDAEMLDVIFDTLTLDFNFAENFGGSLDALKKVIFGKSEFASEWARIKDKTNEAIRTFSDSWKNN